MSTRLRLASTLIATALSLGIVAAGAGGSAASSGRTEGSATTDIPATTHLVIRHAQRGCHLWSTGPLRTASLHLNVAAGGRLHIVNRDVVAHELRQLTGPNLGLRGHIMAGKSELLTLRLPGLYRFTTKVVAMGQEPKVETAGPDASLRLTVSVR